MPCLTNTKTKYNQQISPKINAQLKNKVKKIKLSHRTTSQPIKPIKPEKPNKKLKKIDANNDYEFLGKSGG
jgi:HSP90 family molecular chaperone